MGYDRWFATLPGQGDIRATVIIFPHAGGGVSSYRAWRNCLPNHIGMSVLQMPGKEARYKEPFESNLVALAIKIASTICEHHPKDRPMFFFGHSLGALLAFEVARKLEQENFTPSAMFLSGRRAAHIISPVRYHTWSDEDLILMLREMAGANRELFENETLMSLVLPTIRSDFRLLESYRFNDVGKTNIDIVAFAGRNDLLAQPEEVNEWVKNTNGSFIFKEYEGDHFFTNRNKEEILKYIASTVDSYTSNYGNSYQ